MLSRGDAVVYKCRGVYKVEEVGKLDFSFVDGKKDYYTLQSIVMLNMPAFHPAGVVPTSVAILPTSVFTLSNRPERLDKIPSVNMPRNQSSIICHINS